MLLLDVGRATAGSAVDDGARAAVWRLSLDRAMDAVAAGASSSETLADGVVEGTMNVDVSGVVSTPAVRTTL